MTRYLLLFDSYGLVFVGRPLLREEGFVFCICCWPLPAQSFSGPSPLWLGTIFYCLRFETFLFVASYDSQGHDGGIRPAGTCLPSRCLAMNVYSGSTIPAFRRHVTVLGKLCVIVMCEFPWKHSTVKYTKSQTWENDSLASFTPNSSIIILGLNKTTYMTKLIMSHRIISLSCANNLHEMRHEHYKPQTYMADNIYWFSVFSAQKPDS
jgi:hypothetical protein